MNVLRIFLFIFLFQAAMSIVIAAHIPITCNSSGSCAYLTSSLMQSTTMSQLLRGAVSSEQFEPTKQVANYYPDIFSTAISVVKFAGTMLTFTFTGTYFILVFIFGYSLVVVTMATILQGVVDFFVVVWAIALINPNKGEP